MPRFRRIIAGVSGSPRSLPALRSAADLAGAFDAALIPIHTWVPPRSELPGSQFIPERSVQEWEDAARQPGSLRWPVISRLADRGRGS
jgi:nucleotide-binding universal stress UspA family protein